MIAASPEVQEHESPAVDLLDESHLGDVYHLILWNDDVSPFDLVIYMLIAVLGYTQPKAFETTKAVETSGKGIIYTGSLELCELRHEQFSEVKLTTTIEPA